MTVTPKSKILAGSIIALSLLGSLGAKPLYAQGAPPTQITPSNDTGQKPFNAYSTDGGNVNLMNGNLNLEIPLVTLPGRNGHNFVLSVQYDSKNWTPSATFPGPSDVVYTWKYEKRYPQVGDLGWRCNLTVFAYGPYVYDQYASLASYGDFIVTMPDG